MPISVKIAVNGRPVETLHIGRARGGTRPDDVNDYVVVQGDDRIPDGNEWFEEGLAFTHRYGDGIEECVAKALAALKAEGRGI